MFNIMGSPKKDGKNKKAPTKQIIGSTNSGVKRGLINLQKQSKGFRKHQFEFGEP